MFWDNRGFAQVSTKVGQDLKTPDIQTPDEANLFKAITQEHVSMLKRVKKEENARILADSQLRDEMHSFGLVPCDSDDSSAVFFTLKLSADISVNLWCYFLPLAGGEITQKNWGIKLYKNTVLCFYKINEQPENQLITYQGYLDRYKIRCDINTNTGARSYFIGTSGMMTDGTNLITTTTNSNTLITPEGVTTFYK